MRDLIRAEWLKARTGKAWWVLLVTGVAWILLVCLGVTMDGTEALDQGTTDAATLTTDLVKYWFQMLLFSCLFGAVLVTREFNAHTIGRTVLLSGGRDRVFWAKTIVATLAGLLYAVLAGILSVASAWFFLTTSDVTLTWTNETTLALVGVLAVTVLAAPWGVFIGWIVRDQVVAVAVVLVQILLVEPGLQRLAPRLMSGSFSIALSSIYRDDKPDLFSIPWALLAVLVWLLVAGLAGRFLLTNRDVR